MFTGYMYVYIHFPLFSAFYFLVFLVLGFILMSLELICEQHETSWEPGVVHKPYVWHHCVIELTECAKLNALVIYVE